MPKFKFQQELEDDVMKALMGTRGKSRKALESELKEGKRFIRATLQRLKRAKKVVCRGSIWSALPVIPAAQKQLSLPLPPAPEKPTVKPKIYDLTEAEKGLLLSMQHNSIKASREVWKTAAALMRMGLVRGSGRRAALGKPSDLAITAAGNDALKFFLGQQGKTNSYEAIWAALNPDQQNLMLQVTMSKKPVRWADTDEAARDSLCGIRPGTPRLLATRGSKISLTVHGAALMDNLDLRALAKDAHAKGQVIEVEAGPKGEPKAKAPATHKYDLFKKGMFRLLFERRMEELSRRSSAIWSSAWRHDRKVNSGYAVRALQEEIDDGLIVVDRRGGHTLFRMSDKGMRAFEKMEPMLCQRLNERNVLKRLDEVTKNMESLRDQAYAELTAKQEFMPLYNAVRAWWAGARPDGWDEARHFSEPYVNRSHPDNVRLVDEFLRITKELKSRHK